MWETGLTSLGGLVRGNRVARGGLALLALALTNAVVFAIAALGLHLLAAAPIATFAGIHTVRSWGPA
jgi:hypothetical protein